MEVEKEKRFMSLIKGLAQILNKEVSADLLKVYYFSLTDISLEELQKAIVRYLNSCDKSFFPTPGQLRAMLDASPEAQARDAAARIVEGISKIGLYDHDNEAQAFVGELAWEVVKRQGGWQEVCKSLNSYDIVGQRQAQWRDLAKTIIEKDKLGQKDEAPMLPSTREKQKELTAFIKKGKKYDEYITNDDYPDRPIKRNQAFINQFA